VAITESANTVNRISWGLAKNWIAGRWVDAAKRAQSFDPATGASIGTYADASLEDAQAATEAAVKAFAQTMRASAKLGHSALRERCIAAA
jgi:betaine-aldehyde dehydrogenase